MSVSRILGGPEGNPGLPAGVHSWILPYMLDGPKTHCATGPAAVRPDDDRFVGLPAELGAQFAARATQHDRDNTFVEENFRALRDSRYTALAVPTELGGLGATLRQVCYAQAALARGCASP
jgi:alkylation response protein AidB-like acyl-CoA dehydrogenase